MDKINFSYTANQKIVEDGIKLSHLFDKSKARQIFFTLLMAIVMANSVYGTVNLREITASNAFYFVIALIIIAVVWLEPLLQIKAYKKQLLLKQVEIELKKGKLTAKIGKEKLYITDERLKHYRDEQDYIIVFYGSEFLLLPKLNKSQEEIKTALKFLDNFHSTEKEVN